jgi:hypothetical protein
LANLLQVFNCLKWHSGRRLQMEKWHVLCMCVLVNFLFQVTAVNTLVESNLNDIAAMLLGKIFFY